MDERIDTTKITAFRALFNIDMDALSPDVREYIERLESELALDEQSDETIGRRYREMKAQLEASQQRERDLRAALDIYADFHDWLTNFASNDTDPMGEHIDFVGRFYAIGREAQIIERKLAQIARRALDGAGGADQEDYQL